MTPETQKKVEFILSWYNKEKTQFTFVKQIILIKRWISICVKNEEYEMALALHKEMELIIMCNLKEKRESRSCLQKIKFYFNKLKRIITKMEIIF